MNQPSKEKVLEATDAFDSGPVVTAEDIRIILGCSHEGARETLKQLKEDGTMEKQAVLGKDGKRVEVWFRQQNRGV